MNGILPGQDACEELLRSAVHDLRSPLSQLRALSGLLLRHHGQSLNDDGQELCGFIDAASQRAIVVVDAIHNYSLALEQPSIESHDTNAIVDSAIFTLQPSIAKRNGVINRANLPTVQGDPSKLCSLFGELFTNALKFNRTARPEISVSTQPRDRSILFAVVDNGLGIPAHQAELVFKPFKRLNGFEFDGAGIGLAICRKIVENHGGRIWVEPVAGPGADLRFTLPSAEA